MLTEQEIIDTKLKIFGPEPADPEQAVGYKMAADYCDSIIPDLESAQAGYPVPHHYVATALNLAFCFSSDPTFTHFPEKTRAALNTCVERFTAHYKGLQEQYGFIRP